MDLVKKSINVIKSLQLKNGGILATPLDCAYPFVYVRDGVIMTKALNKTGNFKNSEKFYYFLNKYSKPEQYKDIFHRYEPTGLPSVTRKNQKDNAGLVLHGIYDTYLANKDEEFLKNMWNLVNGCSNMIISSLREGLIYTETSIHEFFRLEEGFEIWSNCACCRGLYDASEIAKILGYKKESIEWKKYAENLSKNIRKKMFNKKTKVFVKNLKYPEKSDISAIAPFYFDIINSKQELKITLKNLQKNLWHKEVGGFKRFKKFEICNDWHWYTGGSGGWVAFTAMIQRFYRETNDKKNTGLCKDWVEKVAARTNGLLPEHIATKSEYELWKMNEIEFNDRILEGVKESERLNKEFKKKFNKDIIYWAVPLGWSHAEYILSNCRKEHQKNF